MKTDREALAEMTTLQLASYWNVLQMGARMLQAAGAVEMTARHAPIVAELLAAAGIHCEPGKLLNTRAKWDGRYFVTLRLASGAVVRRDARRAVPAGASVIGCDNGMVRK